MRTLKFSEKLDKLITDNELFDLLKAGDQSAWEQIYHRYHGALYSHAYRRLSDREEVRDIIHEIFISLWNNRGTLTITSSLSAYLYTSVRSRVLNVYRNRKVRDNYVHSLQDFMGTGRSFVEESLREKELAELLEKEVASLPSQMGLIFKMSRFKYMSHKEIAEELEISPQTVRTQIRNALRILRVKLVDSIFTMLL